jgi:hypothetical protein
MYSTVDEGCLPFCFVVLTFGCPCLGLLSAPNSMHSTVGERCLHFHFVAPTFGNPCLGLLSRPNSTVQYCWREVSLFSFCCRYFRLSLSLFIVRSQQYCTVQLARGVFVFLLLSLLSVVSVSVYCQVPTVLYSTVGERCLCLCLYCSYFRLSLFRFVVR